LFAGAGLALLDAFLRRDPPAAGALRSRLALKSAAACAKILRLSADASALRDLRFAVGDKRSPAANLLRLWRDLAIRPPSLDPSRLAAAAAALDCPAPNADALAETLREQSRAGDPVSAAAKAAAQAFSAFPDAPIAEAEILALWLFDLVLAIRLRWPRPAPLIAGKILDPGFRSDGGGRPRPGDPAWPRTAAEAIALAAASALDLAADLCRRADTLIAVAPKLRAKPASKIVDLLLTEDCVCRSGPPRADDRPRRAPLVRPAGGARRGPRALGPARVPAVRPMSVARRRRRRDGEESLDVELADLPAAARWREWMLRVEAAIFASAKPVPREALVRLVGQDCRFDDLIADLVQELRGRPYDLALVAGGYALRTKTRFAPAIRAVHPGRAGDEVAELTRTETFALTAIAYLQPVTRGEISRLAGREISRDVIASLKRCGLIDGAIRAPQPGAPFAYVTTRTFLEAFGFGSLRELPDLERLKADCLLQEGQQEKELDGVLGLADEARDIDILPATADIDDEESI
jgi:segregation and condensation protein B